MLRNLLFTRYSVKTCELSCPKSTRKVSGLLRNARHVTHVTLGNDMLQATCHLCISQFQLRPSPPPGNCGAFARPVSPWGGALANLARPGGRAFAYPGATPRVLTHVIPTRNPNMEHGGFYRKGLAVRRRLDRPSRTGQTCGGFLDFMHFFIASLSRHNLSYHYI